MTDVKSPDVRLATVEEATVFYYEADTDAPVRYEGTIEIYPGWVHFDSVQGGWVPRGQIEQIHEF